MKPALVLGLALAANAMTADQGDNELIIAPTDHFGNIKQYPGHIRFDEQADDELLVRPLSTHVAADDELIIAPTDEFGRIKKFPGRIMYDEQADDELLVKKPREESKMTEEYKKYLFGSHYKPHPTQVADDELIVAPTDEFGRIKHYPPYIRFDENGNEFFVAPTHRLGEVGHRILYDDELAAHAASVKELLERQFEFKGRLDDADDELMRAPYDRRRRYDDIEGRKVYDDEADAELMMAPLDGTGKYNRRRFDDVTTRKVYDDEADTELMMAPYRRRLDDIEGRKVYDDEADSELMMAPYRRRFDDLEGRKVYDDEADAELMMAPLDGTGKYHRRRFDDVTTRKAYDDDELLVRPVYAQVADDELIRAPTDEFGRIKKFPGHIMYDEQADEELFKRPTSHEDRPKPPTMRPTLFERPPQVVRNDDEVDNELLTRLFPYGTQDHHERQNGVKPTLFNKPQVVRNDDEGDDELAYLGELIKHHKMDRFRDHELPEIRGRKPVSGGFLPVN